MTNDGKIKLLCDMIREYDSEVHAGVAERIINCPLEFDYIEVLPFFKQAARLLKEFYAQQDKQTQSNGRMTGLKKLVSFTLQDHVREGMRGIFRQDGKFDVCNGFFAVRLSEDVSSLPHANGRDTEFVRMNFERICAAGDRHEILLPSIREVKLFLQNLPKGRKSADIYRYQVNENLCVDPRFLLPMLQVFQDATAYHNGNPLGPLYFIAPNGDDGILMPLSPIKSSARAA